MFAMSAWKRLIKINVFALRLIFYDALSIQQGVQSYSFN